MTEQRIPYDEMVQNALLGVVRKVMQDTAKFGLSGAHHFYIAFRTDHPGVDIPAFLKERYKDEMTIVLQNQFWDLKVEEEFFQVGLSFNRKPAILHIPFAAVTGFLDPSVEFGLQFQRQRPEDKADDEADALGLESDGVHKISADTTAPNDAGPASGEANVVALDAFRKKK
ncbi:SspB family protein [Govanella unica]|uniref:ClpXP protease specificity-enhancing factor SspB n=1 Tax=Govanella unica TaxID=2975056 RepID=A0A9X3TZZ2_9PROT|nr:ClpXP protease specificity-enhancing factor SspB [Govania unica]MDA5195096.1 ClpXP protease specificity-enhancing factor SspB [Govania unica]